MANPIEFKPRVDPKRELQKQLDGAPLEHAEELLVVYDILKVAHANGTLDLIGGLVEGRDIIAGKLAEYAKLPGGVSAIRNLMALGKVLMAFDPDTLDNLTKQLVTVTGEHRAEVKPPSLWQLSKRAFSEDGRRGLSFATLMLTGLGRSLKATTDTHDK